MAGKNTWLVGCGIGCAVVVIVVIALGVGGYFGAKHLVEDAREVGAVMDELNDRFGRVADFTPDPEGPVRPERIEAFLAARDLASDERDRLEATLDTLSRGAREGGDGGTGTVAMVRAGLSLLPGLMRYLQRRNEALLEVEMGLGEYLYLYSLIYYSWLGHSPADGPPFVLAGGGHDDGNPWRRTVDEAAVRQRRMEELRQRLGRQLRAMLHNQAAAASAAGADTGWQLALEAEIERMERDRFRLPWQDGLPEPLESSLAPFRARLEAGYRPLVNPVEMAVQAPG